MFEHKLKINSFNLTNQNEYVKINLSKITGWVKAHYGVNKKLSQFDNF
jgi:hypothetical protein